MNIATLIFYGFTLLAVISSVAILLIRNVFYGALLLLVCLVSIAGIYVLLFAEFVAVTQLLIYAGGVLVIVIFGIMLTSKISGKPLIVKNSKWFAGILAGGFFGVILCYFFSGAAFFQSELHTIHFNAINEIGIEIMTEFIIPFEIAAILLLVALIGAAITASFKKQL